MIKGKTSTGFKYELDPRRLMNYELVEVLAEVDANPLLIPKVMKLLLGDESERLKDHVRDEDGFVNVETLASEIEEIFQNHNEIKNS